MSDISILVNKSINILFYKRGLAGNLIKFLLTLDKSTYPYYPKNVTFDPNVPRTEYLNFKNIKWRYGSWKHFHLAYQGTSASQYGDSEDFENFIISDYKNLTLYGHHLDISKFMEKNDNRIRNYDIKFLTIKSSSKFDIVLEDFIKDNGSWVENYPNMERGLQQLELKYNPYCINLDNMYMGTETFIEEYKKLNVYCNLPEHLDDAIKIYKEWAKSRGLARYAFFKK